MSDVIRKAEALAEAIANSEEYKKLKQARETVEEHESAKIMLRDFMVLQETLRQKQMTGQPITEEDKQRWQKMSEVVGYNPYIRSLLEAEMAFSEVMMQVQDILGKVFAEEEEAAQEEQGAPQPQSEAKSKLWVPGKGK